MTNNRQDQWARMDKEIRCRVAEAKANKPPKKSCKWSEEAKARNRERIACRKAGLLVMNELRQHMRNDAGFRRTLLDELFEDYREDSVQAVLMGIERSLYQQPLTDSDEITIGVAFDMCDENGVRLEDER